MFSQKYRLSARIQLVNSFVIHSPFFIIKIAKNNFLYNRYGFIVSKKIDNRAVVRNRVKRRIRACMEMLHTELVTGYDFLFTVKKEAVGEETKVLCAMIEKLLMQKRLFI